MLRSCQRHRIWVQIQWRRRGRPFRKVIGRSIRGRQSGLIGTGSRTFRRALNRHQHKLKAVVIDELRQPLVRRHHHRKLRWPQDACSCITGRPLGQRCCLTTRPYGTNNAIRTGRRPSSIAAPSSQKEGPVPVAVVVSGRLSRVVFSVT